jgi:Flp pilus assembly protein TadD
VASRPGPSANPDSAVETAIAALKTPDAGSALPSLEAALRQAPQDARLWHLLGLVQRDADRRELAIPALRQATALAPHHPLIAHGLARTLLEAGLPAVDAFAKAMQLAPNDPEVVKGMVAALIGERRIGEAIQGMERALARSPQWAEGHGLLSDLRWIEGEREGFARSFDDALADFPRDLNLRRQQFITLLHAEQYDTLLDRIAAGRAELGDQSVFAINEAIAYSERGDTALADIAFEAIADVPEAAVQVRRVRHLLRAGRPGQASAIIDQWLSSTEAFGFWPYASIAWRMTSDPRWEWLEGDPRLVGVYDIGDALPPLEVLADTLRTLHTTRGQPLVQSVRGGTQTDGNLFEQIDPLIVRLREAIRAAVGRHAEQLPPGDAKHPTLGTSRSPIRFSGSWSVRLQAGGFHSNHVHPMGWLSSALYIRLPPDLGDEQAGWLTLGDPSTRALPLDIGPLRMVEPKPGQLVLFPSWMWHGTRPFGEGERLTVAFDVAVPLGTTPR